MRLWSNHNNLGRRELRRRNSFNKTPGQDRHFRSFGTVNLGTDEPNPKTRNPVSILEQRFRHMSDNHDRERARLLAAPRMKLL